MYSQPVHLTHELMLCIQITRKRVDIGGDYSMKSPCWQQVLNLRPSNPDLMLIILFYNIEPSSKDSLSDEKEMTIILGFFAFHNSNDDAKF